MRAKVHLSQDIPLDVDAGGDLDELETIRPNAKDGSLRYVRYRLTALLTELRVVGKLVQPRQKFAVLPLPGDRGPAVGPGDGQSRQR